MTPRRESRRNEPSGPKGARTLPNDLRPSARCGASRLSRQRYACHLHESNARAKRLKASRGDVLAGLPVTAPSLAVERRKCLRVRLGSFSFGATVESEAEMEPIQLDAVEFRAGQRRDWGSAAKGWHDWQELIVSATAEVSKRLVEIAGIKAGDRVLDVAAGSGEPALTAAQVVGPNGEIVATDISSEMLSYARQRAAAAGIENVEFVEAEASSLDFPAESFDAALSRWGIIFEPEAEAAAGRIRGFLKPGARMAISSWGPPERVPLLALPMRTVMTRLNVPPPPPGTPGPLSRPTSEAIAGLLEGGGFSDIEVEQLEVEFEWDSPEAFARFTREIAPPITAMLASHPPEVHEETWAAVVEAARPHADANGRLRLANLVLVAAGRA